MESRKLRIPQNSKLPIGTMVCAALMLGTSFFGFADINGYFSYQFYVPIYFYSFNEVVGSFFSLCVPLLLLVFTAIYAKKNVNLLIVPIAIKLLSDMAYILEYPYIGWFEILAILLLIFIFIFTTTGIIKSKIPLVAVCSMLSAIAFLLLVTATAPFGDHLGSRGNTYYLSSALSFLAFFMGYAFIGLALENDPEKEYNGLNNPENGGQSVRSAYPETSNAATPWDLLENKSIATCIILSIITFGFYGIYWLYTLIKKIKLMNNEQPDCAGELLLNMFIPFYNLYWLYTRGVKLAKSAQSRNVMLSDNGAICLILGLFGFSIVSYAILQNDLNTVATRLSWNGNAYTAAASNHTESNHSQSEAYTERHAEKDPIERIKELNELKMQGILTEEEFELKKRELLSKI